MTSLSRSSEELPQYLYGSFGFLLVPHIHTNTKRWYCPTCLQWFQSESTLREHTTKCPGSPFDNTVYDDTKYGVSVHKLSHRDSPHFIDNLCEIAVHSMDSKRKDARIENYDFYVCCIDTHRIRKILCEDDSRQTEHPRNSSKSVVGFYSCDRTNFEHNLSVIVILAPFQRLGVGSLLVALSYNISKEKIGSERPLRFLSDVDVLYPGPEYPLSDIGKKLYHSFWEYNVCNALITLAGAVQSEFKIAQICAATSIDYFVVLSSLRRLAEKFGSDHAKICVDTVDRRAILQCVMRAVEENSPMEKVFVLKESKITLFSTTYAQRIVSRVKRPIAFQEAYLRLGGHSRS